MLGRVFQVGHLFTENHYKPLFLLSQPVLSNDCLILALGSTPLKLIMILNSMIDLLMFSSNKSPIQSPNK